MIIGRTLQGVSNYIAVGDRPEAMNLKEVDFGKTYADAIQGTKDAMPGVMAASENMARFNTQNLNSILNHVSPGLASTGQQIAGMYAKNSSDMIAGNIPDSVNRQMGGNLKPMDLGMTSFQMTSAALQGVNNWLGQMTQAAAPQQFDAGNLLLSANARLGYESNYNAQKAAVDNYNAKIRAAPGPGALFAKEMLNAFGGAIAGGGGGGGGGGMDMGSMMSMMG